jgi:hypothetical protein
VAHEFHRMAALAADDLKAPRCQAVSLACRPMRIVLGALYGLERQARSKPGTVPFVGGSLAYLVPSVEVDGYLSNRPIVPKIRGLRSRGPGSGGYTLGTNGRRGTGSGRYTLAGSGDRSVALTGNHTTPRDWPCRIKNHETPQRHESSGQGPTDHAEGHGRNRARLRESGVGTGRDRLAEDEIRSVELTVKTARDFGVGPGGLPRLQRATA